MSEKKQIVIQEIQGRMPLLAPAIKEYLTAGFEASYALAVNAKNDGADMQVSRLYFDGGDAGEYIVRFSTDKAFLSYGERRIKHENKAKGVCLGTLLPNTTYYAQVLSADGNACSDIVKFQTEDVIVRPLTLVDDEGKGPRNARDTGGYLVAGGGRMRYGYVYRGMFLNSCRNDQFDLTETSKRILRDELGVRSEIDLRRAGVDDYNIADAKKKPQTTNALDDSLPYYKYTVAGYDVGIGDAESENNLRELFRVLADESNYPVYVHCNAGADRTGTVIFFIHMLLGVSYENATREYELTSFSPQGRRTRDYVQQCDEYNTIMYGKMIERLMTYAKEGEDIQTATKRYLLSIGVSEEELASIRQILVEE
ncbi:MAG: tyrosine-protein phosphatase [Clostridia bacterium]|nr:tyrosine-protein phosphatase [Clostridia bacterium]